MYFWKIYAWTFLFYYVITRLVQLHQFFKSLSLIEWSLLLLSVFGPIGLFLFAYRKKWLHTIFWKIYFLYWIIDFAYVCFYKVKVFGYISTTLYSIILIPSFIGLFLHAFKQPADSDLRQKILHIMVTAILGLSLAVCIMLLQYQILQYFSR